MITPEILKKIIEDCLQKIKSCQDPQKEENAMRGVQDLEKAREELENLYNDRNKIYPKISKGIATVYRSLYG